MKKIVEEEQGKERGGGDAMNDNNDRARMSSLNDRAIDFDASFGSAKARVSIPRLTAAREAAEAIPILNRRRPRLGRSPTDE